MGRRIESIADAFWQQAGGRNLYGNPANIERAAIRTLPTTVIRVANLSTGSVSSMLARIGADPWFDECPRPLRGCLIADAGVAIILVDPDDTAEEQRMTVAHEVAHLLLHYQRPRERAVAAFGADILAVLDRTRPPTLGERLSSALRNVPIEPFRHAMERQIPNAAGRVAFIEDEADELAIELIAPWRELAVLGAASPSAIRDCFGLPAPIAEQLARTKRPVRSSVGVVGLFEKK